MSAGKSGLTFSASNHSYRLDGQKVPGVTTLIGKGLPKPALMYWSAKMVAEWVADNTDLAERMAEAGGRSPFVSFLRQIPWQKRDTAAVRGTDVHDLAEQLVHGNEVEVPEHLAGYVNACVAFLDDWQLKPLVVEAPLASRKWQYAGKADVFGTIKDGRTAVVDWKTSASGIYPETCLQLSAYANAEFYLDDDGNEQPLPKVDLGIGVHLTPDGYTAYEMRVDDDIHRVFLYVARVARAADEMKTGWMRELVEVPA